MEYDSCLYEVSKICSHMVYISFFLKIGDFKLCSNIFQARDLAGFSSKRNKKYEIIRSDAQLCDPYMTEKLLTGTSVGEWYPQN